MGYMNENDLLPKNLKNLLGMFNTDLNNFKVTNKNKIDMSYVAEYKNDENIFKVMQVFNPKNSKINNEGYCKVTIASVNMLGELKISPFVKGDVAAHIRSFALFVETERNRHLKN